MKAYSGKVKKKKEKKRRQAAQSLSLSKWRFLGLKNAGVPLPICIHLQDQGLQVGSAFWTARQSNEGFSVSFFWRVLKNNFTAEKVDVWPQQKKNKTRKRRKKVYQQSQHSSKPAEKCLSAGFTPCSPAPQTSKLKYILISHPLLILAVNLRVAAMLKLLNPLKNLVLVW